MNGVTTAKLPQDFLGDTIFTPPQHSPQSMSGNLMFGKPRDVELRTIPRRAAENKISTIVAT